MTLQTILEGLYEIGRTDEEYNPLDRDSTISGGKIKVIAQAQAEIEKLVPEIYNDKLDLNPERANGWNDVEIVKAEEMTSKAGNQMFKVSLASAEDPNQGTDVYCVAEKGKRWLLKQLLAACGIEPDADGVFDWDIPDIEGKTVQGRVEYVSETWMDREGKERTTQKGKIVEFRRMEVR